MGVAPGAVPGDVAVRLGQRRGVLAQRVVPGLTLEKMGLKPGDVILSFNDRPVSSLGELASAAAATRAGQPLQISAKADVSVINEVAQTTLSEWQARGSGSACLPQPQPCNGVAQSF